MECATSPSAPEEETETQKKEEWEAESRSSLWLEKDLARSQPTFAHKGSAS